MANTITKIRTNFVSITDYDKFARIIKNCTADDDIHIIEHDENGKTKYGFYVEGDIDGIRNAECGKDCFECSLNDEDECDEEFGYDDFLKALQDVIAKDDALIITTISYCKMRELHAYAEIVTASGIKGLTLETLAHDAACEMLGNPDWKTRNYG